MSAQAVPRTRLLAVAAATAAFCVALFPAFAIGMSAGVMVQSLSGGELGADGLPLLMGGALAGLSGLAGYAAALMRPQPVADEPSASPTRDRLPA